MNDDKNQIRDDFNRTSGVEKTSNPARTPYDDKQLNFEKEAQVKKQTNEKNWDSNQYRDSFNAKAEENSLKQDSAVHKSSGNGNGSEQVKNTQLGLHEGPRPPLDLLNAGAASTHNEWKAKDHENSKSPVQESYYEKRKEEFNTVSKEFNSKSNPSKAR